MPAPRKPPPEPAVGTRATLVVTNLMRVAGVAVVLNEVFVEKAIRQEAIAVASVMMLGANALESFVTSFFGGAKR